MAGRGPDQSVGGMHSFRPYPFLRLDSEGYSKQLSRSTIQAVHLATRKGNLSKATRLLQDSKLAPCSSQTVEALRTLNSAGQHVPPAQPQSATQVLPELIITCLKSFPKATPP